MAVQTSQQEAGPGSGRGRGPQLSSRRLPGWLVVVVPVVAELLIGGYRIAGPSLWRDEAATISGSNRSVGAILSLTQHQDAVHGLYYLFIHAVIAVGGTSETALRLPSLIAMALAAGLLAELGRRLAKNTGLPSPGLIGLLAGLLLTVVPLTTRYAQEARPYALTTLFAVLASYLLIRAVAGQRWPWWAGYAAAIVITALFNLFAVLLVVAHGLSLLAARSRPPKPAPGAAADSAGAPAQAVSPAPAGTSAATPAANATPAAAPAPTAPSAPAATPAPAATSASTVTPASAVAANAEAGVLARWLIASGVAAVFLAPIVVLSIGQSAQLNWVTRPDPSTVATLVRDFSGITLLIPVIALLGILGCVAGPGLRRGGGLYWQTQQVCSADFSPQNTLTLAVLALPWLVVPPVLLLAVSLADPLYVERYVMFCLPALSLLTAAGLVWLAELTRRAAAQRNLAPGRERILAIVPSAVLALLILAALISPQRAIRQPSARADNLRAVTAIVAASERPGDAILYLPWDTALVGMAYPAPFTKLINVGLGSSPVASATLRGLPASPAVVTARLRTVRRLWTVQWVPPAPSAGQLSKNLAVSGLRVIRWWRVQSVVLSLYARQ